MNLDRLFTRSTAPIPTRPRVEANLEDQNRWRPLSPTQIDYTDTTGKVFHLDVTEITASIVNRITIVPNSTTPAFVVFLENAVTMAIHFLFSRRSLMAIHALFVEDWKGPVTPLACNAEELHEAYMFVMATLQALVNLPNGLKIGYSSLLMSLAKTDFNFDQRSSIVDGVSMRVMKQGTIIVHMVLPSLVNHATMGAQVLPVAVLSIAHEFIHVFIGHRYGHRLIPKTLEYQKFKAKSRTRPTGSSEPGFVYEKLVVGPSIFPVCVDVEDQNTVQGFGLDFFGHTNSVDVTVAPTNDWLNGFTDGCQADVYLATVPDDSIQLNQIPALSQYVEASRFRNINSLSTDASRT